MPWYASGLRSPHCIESLMEPWPFNSELLDPGKNRGEALGIKFGTILAASTFTVFLGLNWSSWEKLISV